MQWQWWAGWVMMAFGAISGAFFAFKKYTSDDRSQSFIELEKVKNEYKDMVEELKKQIDNLIPKVHALEYQQAQNVMRIKDLEVSEKSCQERVTYVINQNNTLLDILKRFHDEKGNQPT